MRGEEVVVVIVMDGLRECGQKEGEGNEMTDGTLWCFTDTFKTHNHGGTCVDSVRLTVRG
jgi:hypothetical protein